MNFLGYKFDNSFSEQLSSLEACRRMPHAVIINGKSKKDREDAALLISMWAVCGAQGQRPCGKCKACLNAGNKTHEDVYFAKPSGKSGIYSADEIRFIIRDCYTKPNSAPNKAYIIYDADKSMPVISQNIFLKTLEEPPQNTLFILTAENSDALLSTILSRSMVLTLSKEVDIDPQSFDLAAEIARGIIDPSSYRLLLALRCLSDRQSVKEVLGALSALLRDGLACSVGAAPIVDAQLAASLSKRLTRSRLIGLIELTEEAILKNNQNVNLNLLAVWLCGEYRRISWQK